MSKLVKILLSIALFPIVGLAQGPAGVVPGSPGGIVKYDNPQQGTPILSQSRFADDGTNPFYNLKQLATILYPSPVVATKTANATSVTCNTATCTNNQGTYTLVGGTATTGTVITVAFSAPVTALAAHSGAAGTGYAVGDTLTLTCGTTNAVGTITTVSSGAVTGILVTTAGVGCVTASGSSTFTTSGSGTGLTLDVTANLPAIPVCTATQNGGTTHLGIGNSVATTGGFNITSAVTVSGLTVVINYACRP